MFMTRYYVYMEEPRRGQNICVLNILVFAENLTACITDGPEIRNPMGNLIKTQMFKSNLGNQKIEKFQFRQAKPSPEHLEKQMAFCRV